MNDLLKIAIAARLERDPAATAEHVTDLLLKQEREMLQQWLREKILAMVRAEKRTVQAAPEAPFQMFLPGFASLSVKLLVKNRRLELRKATIQDLRQSLKVIKKTSEQSARATRLRTLIEGMRPYAKTNRNITVERYCELAASKLIG